MVVQNAVLVMLCMSLFLGILIAVFAKYFGSKADPKAEEILAVLPAYNCGDCGFPGCRSYAVAVVSGKVPLNKCLPGGSEAAARIREIMGTDHT